MHGPEGHRQEEGEATSHPPSLPYSLPLSLFFLFLSSLSTPSRQCLYKDTLEWTSSPNGAVLLNGNAFHIKGKSPWEGKREVVKRIGL